jgi:DNA (cytosine-5)-methyltransferase 1
MNPPTAAEIRAERDRVGLTQSEAAALVHVTLRAWQGWESGQREMPVASWELFLLKTGRRKIVRA